ncbi:hypothetical protein [Streptomyces sp. ALB3]|uniref:hypothetical protein n=1 Tax=Streptomyces sp. ALB3 TaxID=3374278 RepID=UPI0037BB1EFE
MSARGSEEGGTAVAVEVCVGADCAVRRTAGRAGRPAAAGHRLCAVCLEQLSVELRRLPELYEACGRRLDGGSRDMTRPRTSGGPLRGMPFDAQAAEVRSEILGVLGSWAGAVVEERGVPAPPRAALPLRVFLCRHLGWLAAHEAAGEFAGEVSRLVRRARRVVDPEVRHRMSVGGCVEPGCPGALTAVVRAGRQRLPAVIRCDHDPAHSWPGHEWLQLSRRLAGAVSTAATAPRQAAVPEAESVRWVTAADVARLWDMPTGSVYRHASEARWRRRSLRGHTYYHGGDVVETLSRRRTPTPGA